MVSDELKEHIIGEFNKMRPKFEAFIKDYNFERRYLELPFYIGNVIDFVRYDSKEKEWSVTVPVGKKNPMWVFQEEEYEAYFNQEDIEFITISIQEYDA